MQPCKIVHCFVMHLIGFIGDLCYTRARS